MQQVSEFSGKYVIWYSSLAMESTFEMLDDVGMADVTLMCSLVNRRCQFFFFGMTSVSMAQYVIMCSTL